MFLNLGEILKSNGLRLAAIAVTISVGTLTIYHLTHQIRLTKLNTALAERQLAKDK